MIQLEKEPIKERFIIGEQWHGMERRGSRWCKSQAEAFKKLFETFGTKEEWVDIDGVGIMNWLFHMSEDYLNQAIGTSKDMMEYMLYIVVSPDNDNQRLWHYKVELFKDMFEIAMGSVLSDEDVDPELREEVDPALRKGLEKYWSEIYKRAVYEVTNRAKYAKDFPFYTELIPKESPWTVEDFLKKSDYELLDMLVSAIKKSL